EAALLELADSIRAHGVLEPILVRKAPEGGGYEIIAGERRWRAAQRAGLLEVPIFVRELSDAAAFEAALVENLQREDLNPIETARAFARLIDEFGHSQEQIAQRVGKDRSTIANAIRLLKLPEKVLDLVETGEISEGHGRALLQAPDVASMERLARAASAEKLSVREVERRARAAQAPAKPSPSPAKSANVLDLERRLSNALGSPVAVADRGGKGQLEIRYSSWDELDRLIAQLER
ncbi:MAG: ParB/RepB/Spo0J family partition protein, partial [Myxococcales bacterium]|nr:ParB/RepB/Spo0J family partition protein [Myxococcales bacterium]